MAADLFLVVAAGLTGGLLARLLRQPLIVGYLIAGVVVGPYTGGVTVSDPANIEQLAEIGVTLLLFGLGLELSLKDLAPVRRVALLGTPIQIGLCIGLAVAAGPALGLVWTEAVWLGALVALSSTVVVLKALQAQGRMGTLSSRVMLGMLVAQDLAFVPLIIVLPKLGSGEALVSAAAWATLKAAALLGGVLLVGTRVCPRVFGAVARSGSRELFLLVTLALALGVAYLTHGFGVSAAVGAFVAGLVLSESDFSHQALSDIIPIRDVFSLLFFASVGMLLDPAVILGRWPFILGAVFAVSVAKGVIFWGVTRLFGYRNVVPLASALTLFGVGEFSFVLAREGTAAGLVSPELYALVLNTAIATMVLTPLVSSLTTPIYAWVSRRSGAEPVQTMNVNSDDLSGHVVVAGGGRVGLRIAAELRRRGLPHVVIELDHRRVERIRAAGVPAVFGDAAQPVVLEAAGVARCRLLLVTTPALAVTRDVIRQARAQHASVDIVVRAEDDDAAETLRDLGVAEVVQPDLEASAEMVRQALLHLGQAETAAALATDRMRREAP